MKTPFLCAFAIPRRDEKEKPFIYDHKLNLNVVRNGNKSVPFVELNTDALELKTKTEIEREEDEDNIGANEYATSPRIDEKANYFRESLFELCTKTKIQRESDDE
jgi:hypothetical protein